LLIGTSPSSFSQTASPEAANPPTAPPAAAASAAHPSTNVPLFSPSMGDLMTMLVQPRHIKLGLSGKAQNWVYATYELSELRNAFGRISHTIPTYRTWDTAQMIAALMQRPLNDLDHAIIAADAEKFASAYGEVTEACNACHATQQHPMVVIKAPATPMFPDQDFRRKP
jgi:hypothetical protein